MRIGALDVSKSKTGWAVDGVDEGLPVHGVWEGADRRPNDLAGFLYMEWLSRWIKEHRPDRIIVEAPLVGGQRHGIKQKMEITYPLIGLAWSTQAVARGYKIMNETVSVQTVRQHFLGTGYPADPKNAVLQRCRLLGWEPEDDNAGDALAMWAWAKCTYDRSFRLETATPLFAHRTGAAR
jgi:hypothetical protein